MENTNSSGFTAEEIVSLIEKAVKNEETLQDKNFFIAQIYEGLEFIERKIYLASENKERELENEGEKYYE